MRIDGFARRGSRSNCPSRFVLTMEPEEGWTSIQTWLTLATFLCWSSSTRSHKSEEDPPRPAAGDGNSMDTNHTGRQRHLLLVMAIPWTPTTGRQRHILKQSHSQG
jgi:hypothetical protein